MALRKKSISNLIRLGVSPILAANTQYMQRSTVSLVINLIGLENAVYGILGFKNNSEGQGILHKVIQTIVDIASKKGKDLGLDIIISMVESDGVERFTTLDGEKYGKSVVQQISTGDYSQGIIIDVDTLSSLTAKSTEITECNKISNILTGGLLVQVTIPKGTKSDQIKKVIEKGSSIISSFKPIMQVSICGNCGFKDEKLVDKCPNCKSTYIV